MNDFVPGSVSINPANGEVIAADIVVSNADTAWTYSKLLPPHARGTWTDRKLERAAANGVTAARLPANAASRTNGWAN